jgi:hypothetical protein
MRKAADRATQIGNPELAKWLRGEVKRYSGKPENPTRSHTYIEIQEAIETSTPIPNFASIQERLCSRYSLEVQEFERFYPRARRVYDQAVAEKQHVGATTH